MMVRRVANETTAGPGGKERKKHHRAFAKRRDGLTKDGTMIYFARKQDCEACAVSGSSAQIAAVPGASCEPGTGSLTVVLFRLRVSEYLAATRSMRRGAADGIARPRVDGQIVV
jgi:hypothetical protein